MLSISSSNLFSCVVLVCASIAATQDINITISLNKTTIFRDKQLYGDFITLNRTSTLQVDFNNIRDDLVFIIFQVHSHLYNITLYKNIKEEDTYMKGTNLGQYSGLDTMDTVLFFVQNFNKIDLQLYVAVHGYFKKDPIPGGCNMEFPVPISPYMTAIHNRNYIYVDVPPAKRYKDINCMNTDDGSIQLTFYMLYLPELNFNSDVYFEGIINMMSLKNIVKNGKVIPKTSEYWNTRRMLSSYPGTGAVYVVVAKMLEDDRKTVDQSSYSVYVPTTSYACDPAVEDDCELLDDSLSQFMCASLFFIGIFMCYYGHRFFKTHTFFIGFLSGFVLTYIVVSLVKNDLDRPATLAISCLFGCLVGALRVAYWWKYGLPVFSIILCSADVGFLISSIVFYAIPDNWSQMFYLNLDLNFWTLFVLIITLVTIILLSINNYSNLICCAVIGAYATVLPIDYYLGSQMKYILINIERRATVTDYYKAVKMPTFQWKDWILTVLWLSMAISGFIYQLYQNKGRPPFPPPPRSIRVVPEEPVPVAGPSGYRKSLTNEDGVRSLPYYFNERTPLLSNDSIQ